MVPVDVLRSSGRAGPWPGAPTGRGDPAAGGRRGNPGHRHGQRSANLQRAVQSLRDRAPPAAPFGRRLPDPPGDVAGPAAWDGRRTLRDDRHGTSRRRGPARAECRRRSARPRAAGRRARPGPSLPAARGSARLPLSGCDRGEPGLRLRLGDRSSGTAGSPRRSVDGSGPGSPAPSGPGSRGRRPCGCRATRDQRSGPCSGPASGSRISRSCWAGTRPFADFARYLPISPGLL